MRWTVGLDQPWQLLTATTAAIAMSVLSYRYVEQPVRKWKTSSNRVLVGGISSNLVAAGLIGVLLWPARGRLYLGRSGIESDWRWLDTPIALGNGTWTPEQCALTSNTDVNRMILPERCTFKIDNASRAVYKATRIHFFGNSFAHASIPMLKGVLTEGSNVSVTAVVAWGCHPSSDLTAKAAWEQSCHYYTNDLLPRFMESLTKGDIVVLVYDTSPLTDEGPYANGDRVQRLSVDQWSRFHGNPTTPSVRRDLVRRWLVQLSQAAAEKGAFVVFEAPSPLTRGTNPRRCQSEWFRPLSVAEALCPTLSKAEQLRLRSSVMTMLTQVRATSPNFHVFDPFDDLCPGERCEWFEHSRPIWRDDCHLSEWKAESLGPVFRRFLESRHLLR
jgi:hypothetical protein